MICRAPRLSIRQICIPCHTRSSQIWASLTSKNRRFIAPLQPQRQRSTTSKQVLPKFAPTPKGLRETFDQGGNLETSPQTPTSRDKAGLWGASLFGFAFALYLSFLAVGARNAWQRSKTLDLEPDGDVSSRWDKVDRNYDDEIELAEKAMFMGRKRKRLISQAKGDVLEVSVGTGRNMEYYDLGPREQRDIFTGTLKNVTSIVFNDKAGVMVKAAKKKFEQQQELKLPKQRFRGQVAFVEGDAGTPGVIQGPEAGFDTIVQTMGLCSTTDPVGLLKTLGRLCKKPKGHNEKSNATEDKYGREEAKDENAGGRILLLEHGRGYYGWLNNVLDGLAASHADYYGCWWNRDIGAIVKESGLEVEYIKRYHIGTTWEVVLRPSAREEVTPKQISTQDKDATESRGWMSSVIPWR